MTFRPSLLGIPLVDDGLLRFSLLNFFFLQNNVAIVDVDSSTFFVSECGWFGLVKTRDSVYRISYPGVLTTDDWILFRGLEPSPGYLAGLTGLQTMAGTNDHCFKTESFLR